MSFNYRGSWAHLKAAAGRPELYSCKCVIVGASVKIAEMPYRGAMSDDEPHSWDAAEAAWIAQRQSEKRNYFSKKHKATVSTQQAVRLKTYAWAKTMVEPLAKAREALRPSRKHESYRAIAKWLTESADKGGGGCTTSEGRGFKAQTVGDLLVMATNNYKDQAVLECRTRMTALALSASFETADAARDGLEADCVRVVADANRLADQLNGRPELEDAAYLANARVEAKQIAADQRKNKPMTMEAREKLWKPTPRAVRRIFD